MSRPSTSITYPPSSSTHQTLPPTNPNTNPRTLRIGTRSSALALAQVSLFTTLLATTSPSIPTTTHPSSTSLGDVNKTTDLHTLASGGKSLWTEDLERELLQGRVDCIIHSMKDVPTKLPTGCVCAAVGPRDESRDAVIVSAQRKAEGWTRLGDFPAGGTVGTSSVRRAAMVRRRWPHLLIKDVRGNVGTRLMKLDTEAEGFDALVLAGAGVQRLGLGERISSWLGGEEGVLHAVGQGALGVEWREGDEWVGGLVDEVAKAEGAKAWRVRWECVAERGLLRVLEGGCSVPVGVECGWEDSETAADGRDVGKASLNGGRGLEGPRVEGGYEQDAALPEGPKAKSSGGTLVMHSMVVSLDGKKCVEGSRRQYVSSDAEAEECGWEMARELVDNGAGEILKEITLNRGMIRGQDGA